ncbi:MAG: YdcF family protein [Firmicutes bacterium]|nr:YdcF family protein [Bacillota bacterium]
MRFDTLDKKPKVWNIAVAAVIAIAIEFVVFRTSGNYSLGFACVVLVLFLIVVMAMLANAFVKQLRYNPYSYNTIFYSGFALFALSTFIMTLRVLKVSFLMPSQDGLLRLVSLLMDSAGNFVQITIPFILVFSAGLFISNVSLIIHEGRRLVNRLGMILSVLMVGGAAVLMLFDNVSGSVDEVLRHDLFFNTYEFIYLYFESMLAGVIIASVIVVKYRPDPDKDYMIVLGCGIRKDGTPTPLLRGRIDKALEFRNAQLEKTGKDLKFVVSGGQGPTEVISEAECMRNYLISCGIEPERVLVEDRSTDTAENMKFSKELILADGGADAKVAFATTNYHVFRGGLKARRVKMRAVGIGAKTRWYFWPNAAVREFVGLLTEHRIKQAIILGSLILLSIALTLLAYKVV